jgi:YVTN family beta-propeller protein
MALTSNGTFAYVANSGSNNVSVIAVGASPQVVQTITVGSVPQGVAVSPNSSLVYVENTGSNNVSVISVASNTVTATIPVGTGPLGAAFSPDSSMAYVTNVFSNTVSVIATASSSVVATVTGFSEPIQVALTTDGSAAYVTNFNAGNVSVTTTATNTITATVGVGSVPVGVAIASAPPTTLVITQPLSPTALNVFNFGTNNQAVQYPAGTKFSGINMTTTAVQITPAAFQARVAGTAFPGALCIVYAGAGGNCTDYQVTCTDMNGNPISCPSEPQPTIAVQTGFGTSQAIVNPGYLTTPLGENQWTNIFTGLSDPTVHGKTKGFGSGPLGASQPGSQLITGAEFIAVSLGASNPEGLANFNLLFPVHNRTYTSGQTIPMAFALKSAANGTRVTDATAGLSVTMIADANGNPTSVVVFSRANVFTETPRLGDYAYALCTPNYAVGKYLVTIFGNAFASYQFQFQIVP